MVKYSGFSIASQFFAGVGRYLQPTVPGGGGIVIPAIDAGFIVVIIARWTVSNLSVKSPEITEGGRIVEFQVNVYEVVRLIAGIVLCFESCPCVEYPPEGIVYMVGYDTLEILTRQYGGPGHE